MTTAVCLNCGEFKVGAFAVCPACGFLPNDEDSLTRHLLVSDRYQTQAGLAAIAARVKAGETITFDPEALHAAWVNKAELDRGLQGLQSTVWIWLGVLLIVIVIGAALLILM